MQPTKSCNGSQVRICNQPNEVLKNDAKKQSVFCIPTPGKPNPNEPFVPGINRSRVTRSGQKGNNCAYYALSILFDEKKIGKRPSEEQATTRKIQKIYSDNNKEIAKLLEILKMLAEFDCDFDHNVARNTLKNLKSQGKKKFIQQMLELFLKQKENNQFSNFCKNYYYNKGLETHKNTILQLGFNEEYIKNWVEKMEDPDGNFPFTWDKLSLEEKMFTAQCVVVDRHWNFYGAKKSDWHPGQTFDKLIEEIKEHGCLYVGGRFGKQYYDKVPSPLTTKIEGREIFSWKDAKFVDPGVSHAVIIVGAETVNGVNRVYYMDPRDGSSKDPKSQKIYVNKYEAFVSRITQLNGIHSEGVDGKSVLTWEKTKENDYALYMPK